MKQSLLSYEYIRGLIEGEGSFTFCNAPRHKSKIKINIPAMQLRMHVRDKKLIEAVRDTLGLSNRVYTYHYPGKDGTKRGPQAMLIVREFGNLRDIIIPLFYKRLYGNKGIQFKQWLEKMGSDPLVPKDYKLFYTLYQNGYFEDKAKKYQ